MKHLKIHTNLPKDKLVGLLRDNDFVNDGVKFDDKLGKPLMRLTEKNERIRITCELTERATKDDNFLLGTKFNGRITETEDGCIMSGWITTAPIYHAVWFGLILLFVLQCIKLGGFSVVPVCLAVINVFMFWNEYKKQGIIERYIYRALRRANDKRF